MNRPRQAVSPFPTSMIEERSAPALSESVAVPARVRVWELDKLARSDTAYSSADRFVRTDGQPGVMVTSWIPDEEFVRVMAEHQLRLISDSGAAPPTRHLALLD